MKANSKSFLLKRLSNLPSLTHTHNTVVRFSEVDAMSIVWHGNYFKFFEDGRDGLTEFYGLSLKDFANNGIQAPIVNADISFKQSLTYRDHVSIETTIYKTDVAKIWGTYKVYNADTNVLCVEGYTEQVFTDLAGELQFKIPSFFEKWMLNLPWNE